MSIYKKFFCGFWNIGIIDAPVESVIKSEQGVPIRWMKHRALTKFYADPFPVGEDENFLYILAEEYSYISGKGVIVKLSLNKWTSKLTRKELILESPYHLSFPFPYNKVIIPEQYRAGKLKAYENKIERIICDYPVIDPVILDYYDKTYLFGTLPCSDNKGHNRSLFWFEWNGTKFLPKSQEPIKEDVKSSRFAGAFFKIGDVLYRPAQDCERLYGEQTRIMKVTIDNDEYKEEEVKVVNSSSSDCFNEGLHTFNPWHNIVIVDGFQNERRLFLKPIFVLCRLFRKLFEIN